jgi:hypothetical protein
MEVGCPRLKCQRNSFRLIQTFFINAFLLHSKPPFNKSSKKITPPAAVRVLLIFVSRGIKHLKGRKKEYYNFYTLLHKRPTMGGLRP